MMTEKKEIMKVSDQEKVCEEHVKKDDTNDQYNHQVDVYAAVINDFQC